MNFKVFQKKKFFIPIIFALIFSGCSAKTEGQKKFGKDADYFIGLNLLKEGNSKGAVQKFNKCKKKGSYLCAKKSAEELCNIGSIQEKNQACDYLIKNFNDEDSLLLVCRQFLSSDEISKVIDLTENLDYLTAENELLKIRLEALLKRSDSRYKTELASWFLNRPLSDFHYTFFKENLKPDFSENEANLSPQDLLILFRTQTYIKNYTFTESLVEQILELMDSKTISPSAQIASDIGKTVLYASTEFANNGLFFKNLAEKYKNTPAEFYFYFYAGRNYEKSGTNFQKAKTAFLNARECAESPSQKDNALWYLLDSSLNFSIDSIALSIGEYSKQFCDPDYFDDFFDSLITTLLAAGKYKEIYSIYTQIKGFASKEVCAQFAYITARLGMCGKIKLSSEEVASLFSNANDSGSSLYYKIMSDYYLNKDSVLEFSSPEHNSEIKLETPEEILLSGYAFFGFPEKIYENYKIYSDKIRPETALYLSEFLQKCGSDHNQFYTESLRIASRTYISNPEIFTKEDFKLLYPANFYDYVISACQTYDVPPSVIFALIRSESFFNSEVKSSAGAIGLTQLMEFTGSDIARRLKYSDYSLTDAKTNITFGTYYLSDLYRRMNNSYLLSFFSYNAGINRVRSWQKSYVVDFVQRKNMPLDLFLESLSYSETREYGRKLVSATVVYDWLFNSDATLKSSVESLFN